MDRSELGTLLAQGRTADIYAFGRDAVVKVLRPGFRDEMIQMEADKARVAADLGVPVPRVLDVTMVADRPAMIVERVDGESMLRRLLDRPQKLVQLARLQADLHADLATVRTDRLPSLTARLAERIGEVANLPPELKRQLLNELVSLPAEDRLCHGDFHPDNIILGPRGPVIIDWLDATHGPSSADAARSHLLLSLADPPQRHNLLRRALMTTMRKLFRRSYFARYRERNGLDVNAFAAWIPIVAAGRLTEGIDSEAKQLIAMIERRLA